MTGEEFLALRNSLGMTQSKLASDLGISIATVGKCEKADVVRKKYIGRMLALCRDNGVDVTGISNFVARTAAPPSSALDAYNAITAAAAVLYRLSKSASLPPRPVGRPPLSVDAYTARLNARSEAAQQMRVRQRDEKEQAEERRIRKAAREIIAQKLEVLAKLTDERMRKAQIAVWDGMADQHPLIRAFVDGLLDGSITSMDDPRITLPDPE